MWPVSSGMMSVATTDFGGEIVSNLKIVSGGQTGVDRGALDAALALDWSCGGWCPEGRVAEDGPIPERYPLQELPGGGYSDRTLRNVLDSDGTLVIYFAELEGGSCRTAMLSARELRPRLVVDGTEVSARQAAVLARGFVKEHRIEVLNVAGPRASEEPRAQGYAYDLVRSLLQQF